MDAILDFLVRHGYAVVFAVALVSQLGIPFPSVPWLLAAGALAHSGELALIPCVALAVVASLLAHVAWYEAGRRSGGRILRLVCRISIEPDACVRKSENLFGRRGPSALVIAHFVPGLVTIAQPLAGTLRMPRLKFLAYNLAGSLLWAGLWIGLGYVFGHQLAAVASAAARLGGALGVLIVAALVAAVGWKLYVRRRVLRELSEGRISPAEVRRRLDAGDAIIILDLRHSIEIEADPDPVVIPGSLRIPAEELEARLHEIPRDAEIVLACS